MRIGLLPFPRSFPMGFSGGDETVSRMIEEALLGSEFIFERISINDERVRVVSHNKWLPILTTVYWKAGGNNDYDILLANGETRVITDHHNVVYVCHQSFLGYRDHLGMLGRLGVARYLALTVKSFQQHYALKKVKYVVAVSKFLAGLLKEGGVKVGYVINNAIDADTFLPKSNATRNGLLYAGGYDRYGKGFDILEKLAELGHEIHCVTNINPGRGLTWVKPVVHSEMVDIYNAYDLFIFPSRYESCSMAVIEAMACGLPVIIGPVGIGSHLREKIPEFVVSGWSDMAVDEYCERIKLIRDNWSEFSRRAREYVIAEHSFYRFRKSYIDMFGEVAGSANIYK